MDMIELLGGIQTSDTIYTTSSGVPALQKKTESFSVGNYVAEGMYNYKRYSSVTRIWCGYYGLEINSDTTDTQVRKFDFADNTPNVESWQHLDNFGCSTPTELASLLGGHIKGFVQAFYDVNPSTKVIEITRNISPSTFCIIEVVALQTNHELAYSRIISNKWNVDYTKIISEINKNLFTIAYKDDKIYIKYNENNFGKVFLRSDSGNSLQYTIVSAIPSDATIVQ